MRGRFPSSSLRFYLFITKNTKLLPHKIIILLYFKYFFWEMFDFYIVNEVFGKTELPSNTHKIMKSVFYFVKKNLFFLFFVSYRLVCFTIIKGLYRNLQVRFRENGIEKNQFIVSSTEKTWTKILSSQNDSKIFCHRKRFYDCIIFPGTHELRIRKKRKNFLLFKCWTFHLFLFVLFSFSLDVKLHAIWNFEFSSMGKQNRTDSIRCTTSTENFGWSKNRNVLIFFGSANICTTRDWNQIEKLQLQNLYKPVLFFYFCLNQNYSNN